MGNTQKFLFRNQPDTQWLEELLTYGHIKKDFTSLALEPKEFFGSVEVVLHTSILKKKNKIIYIDYTLDFFKKNTQIARYVVGCTFKEHMNVKNSLAEQYVDMIDGFSEEEEVVIKDRIIYVDGMIKSVRIHSNQSFNKELFLKHNINIIFRKKRKRRGM